MEETGKKEKKKRGREEEKKKDSIEGKILHLVERVGVKRIGKVKQSEKEKRIILKCKEGSYTLPALGCVKFVVASSKK